MKELNDIKILTTDAQSRIGLYAIRYLGMAGYTITSIGAGRTISDPIGFYSRYVNKTVLISSILYKEEFEKFLIKNHYQYDLIVPIFTSSMRIFLDIKDKINIKCKFLLPKKESLLIADNKQLLAKHAQKVGLLCPKTYTNIDPNKVKELLYHDLSFPAIIKFRGDQRSTHWRPEDRYRIVYNKSELVEHYKRMHEIEKYPIIQEYISGVGCGYFALYDSNGQLKAEFCHKRVREYPISGGPSSCCESFYNEQLVNIGRRLFNSLEWSGLGMVEFKYDINRQKFYIIEVNPRYWGSLPLAVCSGVNFPVLHAMSALGFNFNPVLTWKEGVKVRFLDKDLFSIIALIKNEKRISKKFRLLFEILNPTLKDGLMIFNDPMPIIHCLFHKN